MSAVRKATITVLRIACAALVTAAAIWLFSRLIGREIDVESYFFGIFAVAAHAVLVGYVERLAGDKP
jgi:hypothetical protein